MNTIENGQKHSIFQKRFPLLLLFGPLLSNRIKELNLLHVLIVHMIVVKVKVFKVSEILIQTDKGGFQGKADNNAR